MDNYLILLHESDKMPELPEPEMMALFGRYVAWRQRLLDSGKYLGSNKLEDNTGRVIRLRDGQIRLMDGPFTETKDLIGGYFLVQAESYEGAVALCDNSPHLEFGTIEIRRVDRMAPPATA